ncbi:MAG: Maf family protein [Gammaproteobacteria bacterium]|nr:Maf family protein [Gammaproteobacteria bacterium]
MNEPQITLASASPRRAALLRQIGITFEVKPSEILERQLASECPEDYVQRLARTKAATVQHDSLPALGADTIVVREGQILEKPVDREEAIQMLRLLQGERHRVLTGVCLHDGQKDRCVLATAEVVFRRIASDELERYWESGEPTDKAGAYGIQGLGAIFIAGICGQPSTVAGLPLVETNQLLCEFGVDVWRHRNAMFLKRTQD